MSNRNFINSGLRILEAPNGDLCITDKGGRLWWKGKGDTLFLNAEIMEDARLDDRKAAMMFRLFSDFIKAHRNARSKWDADTKAKLQASAQ